MRLLPDIAADADIGFGKFLLGVYLFHSEVGQYLRQNRADDRGRNGGTVGIFDLRLVKQHQTGNLRIIHRRHAHKGKDILFLAGLILQVHLL